MKDERPLSVLFFGASGAGKGTQAELLKSYLSKQSSLGVLEIDMGARLRETVEKGGYVGRKINEVISKGEILPGTVPVYFFYDFIIKNLDEDSHLIADGVVRSPVQVQAFHEAMTFFDRKDYKVLFIKLSDESIRERLKKRGRNDDSEEGIERRIKLYKEEIFPLLRIFENFGKEILQIDGEPDIDTVHESVKKALGL